jgi:hypothetical protein
MNWKLRDAYFAKANVLLDNGKPPADDIKLQPGQELQLMAVFPVPGQHNAAAFLVVLNSWTVSRKWIRKVGGWTEARTLVAGRKSSNRREAK